CATASLDKNPEALVAIFWVFRDESLQLAKRRFRHRNHEYLEINRQHAKKSNRGAGAASWAALQSENLTSALVREIFGLMSTLLHGSNSTVAGRRGESGSRWRSRRKTGIGRKRTR